MTPLGHRRVNTNLQKFGVSGGGRCHGGLFLSFALDVRFRESVDSNVAEVESVKTEATRNAHPFEFSYCNADYVI
jgi:hypothetical protein